jgi:hypothetical protein
MIDAALLGTHETSLLTSRLGKVPAGIGYEYLDLESRN